MVLRSVLILLAFDGTHAHGALSGLMNMAASLMGGSSSGGSPGWGMPQQAGSSLMMTLMSNPEIQQMSAVLPDLMQMQNTGQPTPRLLHVAENQLERIAGLKGDDWRRAFNMADVDKNDYVSTGDIISLRTRWGGQLKAILPMLGNMAGVGVGVNEIINMPKEDIDMYLSEFADSDYGISFRRFVAIKNDAIAAFRAQIRRQWGSLGDDFPQMPSSRDDSWQFHSSDDNDRYRGDDRDDRSHYHADDNDYRGRDDGARRDDGDGYNVFRDADRYYDDNDYRRRDDGDDSASSSDSASFDDDGF